MFRIDIFLYSFWMISISGAVYDELYRPQLHYSPPKGWLWDPDGLVYGNGIYHLFYQHHPNKTTGISDIHWGHAISSDLIHWKPLDTALYPPSEEVVVFSGGAIFDHNNITGFQTNPDVPTLILMPAAANWTSREQDIWLAYSNDGPEYVKFHYYKNNPIIPGPRNTEIVTAHRDTTVFKYEDYYVTILASYNRTKFYKSHNLLQWELMSEFGEFDGSHAGRWECPSLSAFNVTIDGKLVEKYVMTISMTDFAFPSQQYLVGSFDGKKFTNENPKDTILWREHGPDNLAGVTYNNLPDGRRILINWMGRGEYALNFNFSVWNGQMGIPRELNLVAVNDQIRLASLPIREIESLRINAVRKRNITIKNKFIYDIADSEKKRHLADIEMMLNITELKRGDAFDIVFSGKKDKLKISFEDNEFIMDRSRAGKYIPSVDNTTINGGNFDNPNDEAKFPMVSFHDLIKVPRVSNSSDLKLRIIIDTNSIDMFADDGLTVISALFISDDGIASRMNIQVHSTTSSSLIQLKELNVYEMKSIWHNKN